MLISLDWLVFKYKVVFNDILHVGAHECEELLLYERYVKRDKILWVEALADKVVESRSMYAGLLIEQAVISDKKEIVKFNRSNNGQSSSLLEFGLHKTFHPHVWYVDSFEVETILLKDVIDKYPTHKFNFINLDIQGTELKALKSMGKEYLDNIDYVYTEVNCGYVYENCAIIDEIDAFLETFGLIRVETCWCENYQWGDAFYMRRSLMAL